MTHRATLERGAVTLRLDETDDSALSLSGATLVGDTLFLAPDEGATLIALTRDDDDFRSPERLPVGDLVEVPSGELDLEGMDHTADALWIVGSHGGVRTKAGKKPDKVFGNLGEVTWPASRRVLARLPLDGTAVGKGAVLPVDESGLRNALGQDDLLKPFLGLPSKDNGLDVEGLAIAGERILLGLRGPVLRGWAVILEIEPSVSDDRLELGDPPYRKHLLDLDGLGCRDLLALGDDLVVLAGPTMVLDGPSRLLRIRGGTQDLPNVVMHDDVQLLTELDTGNGEDHPEAIAALDDRTLLLAYDSPSTDRRTGNGGVQADLVTVVH